MAARLPPLSLISVCLAFMSFLLPVLHLVHTHSLCEHALVTQFLCAYSVFVFPYVSVFTTEFVQIAQGYDCLIDWKSRRRRRRTKLPLLLLPRFIRYWREDTVIPHKHTISRQISRRNVQFHASLFGLRKTEGERQSLISVYTPQSHK